MPSERQIEQVGCIKCGKSLHNILADFDGRANLKHGYQPVGGLAFNTQGHYGTTYFDPMDGTYLEIVVCDECVKEADRTGHVFHSARPLPDEVREDE